jgi:hypothetical protein
MLGDQKIANYKTTPANSIISLDSVLKNLEQIDRMWRIRGKMWGLQQPHMG